MQFTVHNFAEKVRVSAFKGDYNYKVRRAVLKEPEGEKETTSQKQFKALFYFFPNISL
jgi:hypothetical protein